MSNILYLHARPQARGAESILCRRFLDELRKWHVVKSAFAILEQESIAAIESGPRPMDSVAQLHRNDFLTPEEIADFQPKAVVMEVLDWTPVRESTFQWLKDFQRLGGWILLDIRWASSPLQDVPLRQHLRGLGCFLRETDSYGQPSYLKGFMSPGLTSFLVDIDASVLVEAGIPSNMAKSWRIALDVPIVFDVTRSESCLIPAPSGTRAVTSDDVDVNYPWQHLCFGTLSYGVGKTIAVTGRPFSDSTLDRFPNSAAIQFGLTLVNWATDCAEVSLRQPFPPGPPLVIVSIHGVMSDGHWQSRFQEFTNSTIEGSINKPFSWGKRRPILPPGIFGRFAESYDKVRRKSSDDRIDVVAHSAGTYILGKAMLRHPAIRFRRILMVGSVLSPLFDWELLQQRGQYEMVKNEVGTSDRWVRFSGLIARVGDWHLVGPSGRTGFRGSPTVVNRRYEFKEHSDFFTWEHMRTSWYPFLAQGHID